MLRLTVALVTLGLLATSCTGSDNEGTSTTDEAVSTTSEAGTPTTKAAAVPGDIGVTMDDVLGGTQAVQDFAIFVGMWRESGDQPGTFYADVLGVAGDDPVSLGELSGGFSLYAAEALTGAVVDRDRNPIPSLRADYGLVVPSQGVLGDAIQAWAAENDPDGSLGLEGLFDATSLDDSRLLVEVITADYTQARTQAGPGDLALMDLSAVASVAPGDDVAMSYIFGQTYPGDPDIERDLAPLDLFRYRWNRGLIAVLSSADGEGGESFPDHSVRIVDGSALAANERAPHFQATLVANTPSHVRAQLAPPGLAIVQPVAKTESEATESETGAQLSEREIKQMILLDFVREQQELLTEEAIARSLGETDFGVVDRGPFQDPAYVIIESDTNEVIIVSEFKPYDPDCFGLTCPYDNEDVLSEMTYEEFAGHLAAERALVACGEKAAELNRRNEAQTVLSDIGPPDKPIEAIEAPGDVSNGSGEDEGETDPAGDPLAPQPGPVSCSGAIPGGPPKLPTPEGIQYGDVHAYTIDGKHYTNQAVGEFLVFDNGVAQVQMRTEPWERSLLQVSVVTAFAVWIGDHKVSMQLDGSTWIDGELSEIERGHTIDVGDGQLLRWEQGWVVVWPDGTVFRPQITEASQLGRVSPAPGPATGLLGDFDGNPDNDFFTRDGVVLRPDIDEDFEEFYRRYVDSWRITSGESAFHYEDGESTETYTISNFPTQPVSLETLAPDARADAELLCARVGVEIDAVFEDCVVDVALTGEPSFALQASFAEDTILRRPNGPAAAVQPAGRSDNALSFGGTSLVFGPEPPVLDPTGPSPKWTCQADDGVFTAISSFSESPTVNWDLDIQYISPENSFGRDEAFRVIVERNGVHYAWVQTIAAQFEDAVESVSLDDDTLTAEGVFYVNDPPTPGLGPINPLPEGAQLTPFTLAASCG